VTLVQQGGKWTTIPARWLQPSARPGAPRPLPAFAAIRLHNVSVRYEDADAHFIADTTGLSLDLTPDGSGERGSLAGGIAPGAVTKINLEPRGTTLRILGGRARFSPHGAGVDGLRIEAPEGSVSSDVRFVFRGDKRFQLKTAGTLRGESLGAWLEPLEALRGTLNAEFAMPAAGGAPAFADVKVTAKDLVWRDLPVHDVAAQGALDVRGITLNSTAVRIGSGVAEGNGRLAWATSARAAHALVEGCRRRPRVEHAAVLQQRRGVGRTWIGGERAVRRALDGWHAAALSWPCANHVASAPLRPRARRAPLARRNDRRDVRERALDDRRGREERTARLASTARSAPAAALETSRTGRSMASSPSRARPRPWCTTASASWASTSTPSSTTRRES
jgi:hypothetical protein